MIEKWQIPPEADDWKSDWAGSERFHIAQFRQFSFREKIQAMEDMAEVVERFRQLREERRKKGAPGGAPRPD
ncbi:MAG: hypothetical protein V1929_08405 [bacterium]